MRGRAPDYRALARKLVEHAGLTREQLTDPTIVDQFTSDEIRALKEIAPELRAGKTETHVKFGYNVAALRDQLFRILELNDASSPQDLRLAGEGFKRSARMLLDDIKRAIETTSASREAP